MFWYIIFSYIFFVFFKLYSRLRIEGRENLPSKTNFIIVANHTSFLDPLVMMAATRKMIYCIAMRDIYKFAWMRWFLKAVKTIPSGSASAKAITLLEQNKNVGLFPEGGVSRDGLLREFRRGAALLAYKTGRPVVPCAILGTYQALPFGKVIPKPSSITVRIGKPIFFTKELNEVIDDQLLQEGTSKIQRTVKSLLYATK
ncbi:MAG: 1-acyl-sn-glycerol-3-phosphate acyltransferase [Candidatus Omnitrophica bacterium]|nr:1-acyl-sn-glycerol-3-phosphate acyltransferase [Candidatus Omnitrophota bacterium]